MRSEKRGNLRRKNAIRSPARRFVIFAEGKNTEPAYFSALEKTLKQTLLDIEIVGGAGVPMTIANKAKSFIKGRKVKGRRLDSFEENDEIWAVFDRDQHPNIEQAISLCKNFNIGVAYSNPCFELWLILHFIDFDSPEDRYGIQKYLENICHDYDKDGNKRPDCRQFIEKIADAEKRARSMNERRIKEGASMQAPWTTVYELTMKIRNSK